MAAPWRLLVLACTVLLASTLAAQDFDYRLVPKQVAPDTWVVVGRTEDFSRQNGGNIVNTAFVVTRDGVVVIDTGATRRYGEQLRAAIRAVTDRPVLRVWNTHHHPDHFLGNQGFADVPIAALPLTRAGQQSDGAAFADNVYRMAGDWAKGTEPLPAAQDVKEGGESIGGHDFVFLGLSGHTVADLAILDRTTGVLFAGDLVFYNRAPTTPHASIAGWRAALQQIERQHYRLLIPGHGEPVSDGRAVAQTRRWLEWVDGTLREAATLGQEMTEVLARPLPADLAAIALSREEFARSIAHLYRGYEAATLHKAR